MVLERPVASRSGRADDELEIRNLLAMVAHLCDRGDLDEYLELFTDDAVWEMPDNPQLGVAGSRRAGKAAIAEGVSERRAAGVQGPGTSTAHVVTTRAVRFDSADVATADAYWLYFAETAGAPVLKSMGHYADTLRRTPGGWKLAQRRITVGVPSG